MSRTACSLAPAYFHQCRSNSRISRSRWLSPVDSSAAAIFFAASYLIAKRLSGTSSASVVVFLLSVTVTVGLAPFAWAVWVPFANVVFFLPWIVYIIFAAFVIVGADNAVNLTDGVDGLAAGVTLPVALFFMAVGFRRSAFGLCAIPNLQIIDDLLRYSMRRVCPGVALEAMQLRKGCPGGLCQNDGHDALDAVGLAIA